MIAAVRRLKVAWADLLRTTADRIDPEGAPRCTGWTFTYELGEGVRFREHDETRRGCRLWYYGRDDYDKAFNEADTPWTVTRQ